MYSNTFSSSSIFISKCRIFFCPDQAWNSRSGCSSCCMYSTFTSFNIPLEAVGAVWIHILLQWENMKVVFFTETRRAHYNWYLCF